MTARYESQRFQDDSTGSITLAQGATSKPRIVSRFTDKTVQVDGVLSGATVTIEGRITSSWVALFTGVGLGFYEVSETVDQLRVVINGGDGSTAIEVAFAGFDTRVGH